MQEQALRLVLPLAALAADVAVQMAWHRLARRKSLFRSMGAGFAAGLGVLAWLEAAAGATGLDGLGLAVADLVIYTCLGYFYYNFISLGETGRRVRLMWELHEAPRGLTMEELLARYPAGEVFSQRLGRLLRKGQVRLHGDRYRIANPTMLLLTRAILGMKRVVMGKGSEFQ